MKETLHVAFCVNEPYVSYMCVALKGIACNHSNRYPIMVHVLTDHISNKAKRLIDEAIYGNNSIDYLIHEVDDSPLEGVVVHHYTIFTWYRMLLPALLPDVDKILYLDTDTAVNGNFDELHDFNIDDYAIATPHDTDTFIDEPFLRCGYEKPKEYVCVGVMLMNLDFWRRHNLAQKVIDWGLKNASKLKYPDQDSINYVCQDLKTYIPLKYGVTKSLFTKPYFYTPEYKDQMNDCLNNPVVIHYAGCAPWFMESEHPLTDIWKTYNRLLPHPAKRRYSTKGITGLKVRIWDILHLFKGREIISCDEIKRRIDKIL